LTNNLINVLKHTIQETPAITCR